MYLENIKGQCESTFSTRGVFCLEENYERIVNEKNKNILFLSKKENVTKK